jgi:hypothetical protein
MLWFFDRDDESLRPEIWYDNDTAEFVALVHFPDGQKKDKRFADIGAFRQWLESFERNLAIQYWISRGGPVTLWTLRRTARMSIDDHEQRRTTMPVHFVVGLRPEQRSTGDDGAGDRGDLLSTMALVHTFVDSIHPVTNHTMLDRHQVSKKRRPHIKAAVRSA